jgi:hypothetical protein
LHNFQTTLQTRLQTILIACTKEETAMESATRYYALFVAAAVIAVLGMQAGSASLNGMKWNDFRKSQCDLAPSKRSSAKSAPAGTAIASNAVFPSAVDAKYSKEKPGRARRKTSLDQYKANKASDANGGLKWLQKGAAITANALRS